MHGERALDADAEAELADGERLVDTGALAADDHALEDLDPLAGPLDHPHVDLQRVAGPEGRDVVTQAGAVDEIGGVHGAVSFVRCCSGTRHRMPRRPRPPRRPR